VNAVRHSRDTYVRVGVSLAFSTCATTASLLGCFAKIPTRIVTSWSLHLLARVISKEPKPEPGYITPVWFRFELARFTTYTRVRTLQVSKSAVADLPSSTTQGAPTAAEQTRPEDLTPDPQQASRPVKVPPPSLPEHPLPPQLPQLAGQQTLLA